MADNLTTTTTVSTVPSGSVIATDDVSGVHFQKVKIDVGGDGASVVLSNSNPLPVSDAGGALTVDGTVAATQSGTWNVTNVSGTVSLPTGASTLAEQQTQTTSLQLIDDTVYTDGTGTPSKAIGVAGTDGTNPQIIKTDAAGELQVDVLTSALPSGAATSAKQDTQITAEQAIQTAVEIIDNAISGSEMQVDVVAALPAGTNNIGDVDVLSIVPGTGATNLGKAIDTATGATDTGVLALATRDDALSALTPIEGDNVQLRTDANGALWTHDDALDAALSGSELQVDVVAALPAGTNNIGDVDILSIAAGDNNIGNVDIASIAAGDNNIGNVDLASAIPAGTNAIGKLLPPDTDVTAHTNYARKYYANTGAATDGIIWSPAAGKRWHVVSMYLNVSAACTVTLEDDKAGGDDPVWKGEYAANSGVTIYFGEQYPMASGEDAADLLITTTAGNVYVTVTGYEV